MATRTQHETGRLGALDYALMALGSSFAVYSAGMAVGQPQLGVFFVGLVIAGTLLGYVVRLLGAGSKALEWDGILYAIAVVFSMVFANPLNPILPQGGFPQELMMAAVLSWILAFGSAFAWRDGTLLFQAVPAIALFGLVGCYDTYRDVPLMFFAFLVCLATLFARSQAREMLRQAVASGYFGPDVHSDSEAGLFERIKSGPWRWVAGPEWALASALVIVFVSFLGAPVIEETVKPVSGLIAVRVPRSILRAQRGGGEGLDSHLTSTEVGRGPHRPLSDRVVFEADLDKPRYLHQAFFDLYTGRGWRKQVSVTTPGQAFKASETAVALSQIPEQNRHSFRFSIRALVPTVEFPVPGVVTDLDGSDPVSRTPTGEVVATYPLAAQISGHALETKAGLELADASQDLPPDLGATRSLDNIPADVIQFAQDATRGATSDADKANMLLHAIGRQAKYNLKAEATPDGQDPVDYFLFGQKQGYCDLFASAMVTCSRAVGIPARYVIGYLPDAKNGNGHGTYAVTEADYHAWAELCFKGAGWVPYDATAFADVINDTDASGGLPWYQQMWFLGLLDGCIAILVLGAGYFAIRALRPVPGQNPAKTQVDRTYLEFAKRLKKATGIRRSLSQTPQEYVDAVRPKLNGTYEPTLALTRKFERAMYSNVEPDQQAVAELRQDLRNLEPMLKKSKADRKG